MSSNEQRKASRTDSLNLSFFSIDEEDITTNQGMGRTLNISVTGILLETSEQIPKGKTVNMDIAVKDDIINAKGTVIHSTENDDSTYRTGIHFTTISKDDQSTLKKSS